MGVSVGKSEVYQFDILSVACQHDVPRLDVPVDNLAVVEGIERVAKFEYDPPCKRWSHLSIL